MSWFSWVLPALPRSSLNLRCVRTPQWDVSAASWAQRWWLTWTRRGWDGGDVGWNPLGSPHELMSVGWKGSGNPKIWGIQRKKLIVNWIRYTYYSLFLGLFGNRILFVKPNPHPTDASYVQWWRGVNIGILIAEKCHNPLVLDQLPNKVISQSPIRESQHGVTVSSSSLGRETSLVGRLGMAEKRQALGVKPQPGSLRCCRGAVDVCQAQSGKICQQNKAGLQTQIRYLPGTLTICMVIRPWVSDGHEQRIYSSHKEPQNGNHASKLQQQTRNFNQKPLLISVKDSGFKRIPFAKLTLKLGPFAWNLPPLQTSFAQNKGHESHQASYLLKSPLY